MASNFISYTKHGVAESTLLKATKVGHHYNLVNESKDIDNGSVAVIGDRKRADVFEAKSSCKRRQNCSHFNCFQRFMRNIQQRCRRNLTSITVRVKLMRAYEIQDTDRFTLSTESFQF